MPVGRVCNGIVLLALLLTARPSAPTRDLSAKALGQNNASRANYVGDAACRSCHQSIDETYLHTGHHLTSQQPSESTISGKFTPPSNVLRTADPNLHFVMSMRDGKFFQSAVFGHPPDELMHTEPMDVVVGSGERGQSYLYWKGDRLYQLPVSYWTQLGEWVNSPGYTDGTADFTRPIDPRCFECHAGYIASIPSGPPENRYEKTGFVLGITCEQCHGAGRQHVELEKQRAAHPQDSPPAISAGKIMTVDFAITNPKNLSRDRQVDVCAECHGGLGRAARAGFLVCPRPRACGLSDAGGSAAGREVRRTRKPSSASRTQPLLSKLGEHELHHLPRRSRAGAPCVRVFGSLPGLPQSGKLRPLSETRPRHRQELH